MSAKGKKSTTLGKIPEWEPELWSYLSKGDGMVCPVYNQCQVRQQGGLCLNDNKQYFKCLTKFIEQDEIEPSSFELTAFDFMSCKRSGRLFELVEMLAEKYFKKTRARYPPVPTNLILTADDKRPIEIHHLPLKNYRGAIWRLKDKWVIQIRNDDTPARQRFTIFHEIFHILAHCSSTPVFRKIGTREGSFNELLADCFSTRLQVPKEWAKEKWAEVEDLDRLAEIFDVPKPAMCIRLRQLGLV